MAQEREEVTEGRAHRVEGSLGRRGSLGEERLPLCVQPLWGRGGVEARRALHLCARVGFGRGSKLLRAPGNLRGEARCGRASYQLPPAAPARRTGPQPAA